MKILNSVTLMAVLAFALPETSPRSGNAADSNTQKATAPAQNVFLHVSSAHGHALRIQNPTAPFPAPAVPPPNAETSNATDQIPDGKGIGTILRHGPEGEAKAGGGVQGNGISYHGGPLLLGQPAIYYIWYGNWVNNTAVSILPAFAGSLGGSPYFNINTTYYNGFGIHVTNTDAYGGSASDNYSRGTTLSDSDIQAIVAAAIQSGALPSNTNATYLVLTSADVNETSGFCTNYCAWHTHGTINGSDIKYGFIGDPDRCPSACEAQTRSPNGNSGADGMANLIAHEFEESVTDPDLNAWYNRRGQENADMCAWKFGTTSTLSNGAQYNMTLGGMNYLIQENWVNAGGGYCAIKYP